MPSSNPNLFFRGRWRWVGVTSLSMREITGPTVTTSLASVFGAKDDVVRVRLFRLVPCNQALSIVKVEYPCAFGVFADNRHYHRRLKC